MKHRTIKGTDTTSQLREVVVQLHVVRRLQDVTNDRKPMFFERGFVAEKAFVIADLVQNGPYGHFETIDEMASRLFGGEIHQFPKSPGE